jgi:hypothetical protein
LVATYIEERELIQLTQMRYCSVIDVLVNRLHCIDCSGAHTIVRVDYSLSIICHLKIHHT